MSTNDPPTVNDSGSSNDRPQDCPLEVLEATLAGCETLLDRAVSPTTTARASDVAAFAAVSTVQAGYALRAITTAPETIAARLGHEPAVQVTLAKDTPHRSRYRLAPSDAP